MIYEISLFLSDYVYGKKKSMIHSIVIFCDPNYQLKIREDILLLEIF